MPVKKTTLQGAEYLDYWGDMFGEDCLHYLEGAGPYKPCAWCGGHAVHSDPCKELQDGWNTMQFGKHQGKHIKYVSTGYLEFLILKCVRSQEEREKWLLELQTRDERFNHPLWQQRVIKGEDI